MPRRGSITRRQKGWRRGRQGYCVTWSSRRNWIGAFPCQDCHSSWTFPFQSERSPLSNLRHDYVVSTLGLGILIMCSLAPLPDAHIVLWGGAALADGDSSCRNNPRTPQIWTQTKRRRGGRHLWRPIGDVSEGMHSIHICPFPSTQSVSVADMDQLYLLAMYQLSTPFTSCSFSPLPMESRGSVAGWYIASSFLNVSKPSTYIYF